MKIIAWICGLLVVLLVALSLRERFAPASVVPPGMTLAGGSSWQIDDFDGAYHLRRVQVALATGKVPDFDSYINHPGGSAVPWPTFFDGLLTIVVEALVDPVPDGSPELGGYREGDIEAVLVHVPPFMAVVAALGVALLVLAVASRSTDWLRGSAPWWALFGALVYALVPTAIMYGSVARVDHHVATGLFLAFQLACVARALITRDPIEGALMAIGAGLAGAFGILTWLAHGVFLGLCGIGFAQRALSRDEVDSRRGWQGGATFFAVATLVVLWPAWTSPWNDTQPGSLINLSMGVPRALGAAAVPFLVYGLAGRRTSHRGWRSLAGALALIAVVFLLPGFVSQVREGMDWADRSNQFMAVIDESAPMSRKSVFNVAGIVGHLGYLWYALPVAALALLMLRRPEQIDESARTSRGVDSNVVGEVGTAGKGWRMLPLAALALLERLRPERVVLLLTTALLFAAAVQQRRFADALSVPMAATLAIGAMELARYVTRFVGERAKWVPAAALALVAAWPLWATAAMAQQYGQADMVGNAARWNLVLGGLRWMRDNTPSPGPWNDPLSKPTYGVLASWSDGHLIEYHARRPTVATNFGSFVGIENFQAGPRALLENDPDEFVRKLEALDVRYVVVRPRFLSWFMDESRVAGWTLEERRSLWNEDRSYSEKALRSPYFQLALHDQQVGDFARRFPALELVWRSPLRIDMFGKQVDNDVVLAGPSLSIWRVIGN